MRVSLQRKRGLDRRALLSSVSFRRFQGLGFEPGSVPFRRLFPVQRSHPSGLGGIHPRRHTISFPSFLPPPPSLASPPRPFLLPLRGSAHPVLSPSPARSPPRPSSSPFSPPCRGRPGPFLGGGPWVIWIPKPVLVLEPESSSFET